MLGETLRLNKHICSS